jgi:hypothetical protein
MEKFAQSAEFLLGTASKEKRQIFGVVAYADVLSVAGDYFSKETLQRMAQQFMIDFLSGTAKIDVQHKNNPIEAFPYVSFVTGDSPEDGLPANAWMIGVKVLDDLTWEAILEGELCSFSMECLGHGTSKGVILSLPRIIVGVTEPANHDGHFHTFIIHLDPTTGMILSGVTSEDEGHSHQIKSFSRTERRFAHNHRYFTSFE